MGWKSDYKRSLPHWGIITLYFINAFYQAFPGTALGDFLFLTLRMSPATSSLFYSVAFLPFIFKPIYGLISDLFPIMAYRRKPYILMCQILIGSTFIVMGTYVTTITAAFIVKVIDSTGEAFTQTLIGIMIADLAKGELETGAKSQAVVNAAGKVGLMVANLAGTIVYQGNYNARSIIAWTSVVPFLGIFSTLFGLKEKPLTRKEQTLDVGHARTDWRVKWARVKECIPRVKACIPFLLFLFLSSALPSDVTPWFYYTFTLFAEHKACIQYCRVTSDIGAFLSCLCYYWVSSRKVHFKWVLAMAVIAAAVAGIPRILLAPPISMTFGSPAGLCAFAATEGAITSFAKTYSLLPLLTVATTYASKNGISAVGTTYSFFMAAMNLGGFLSGIVSAALLKFLGIDYSSTSGEVDWSNLYLMILITAGAQVVVLLLLPLIDSHLPTSASTIPSPPTATSPLLYPK